MRCARRPPPTRSITGPTSPRCRNGLVTRTSPLRASTITVGPVQRTARRSRLLIEHATRPKRAAWQEQARLRLDAQRPLLLRRRSWSYGQAVGGIIRSAAGTSVATETCGQVRPAKFRNTDCEYWICVDVTMISMGAGMSCGGSTRKTGASCPGLAVGGVILTGASPRFKIGMRSLCCTVSIQNVADIVTASALGLVIAALPSRKAILSVPPPNTNPSGDEAAVNTIVWVIVWPAIASRRTALGSSRIAWVIVPAAMKGVRS